LRIVGHFNYSASGQLFNTFNQSGRIESFDITDGKGIKYTFDKHEGALLADDDYQFGKNIVSTWYLSKIETPNGNTLDFIYIQRTIDQPHAQSEYRYLFEASLPNLDSNPHVTVSESTTTETVLQEILINGGERGKVEFVEDATDRADWGFSLSGTKPKSLKEVRLKDGQNNLVRKFVFTYDPNANRLLLRSVQEYGPTNTANEPYTFEYYNESDIPPLPSGGSNVITREDHFGYYNANTTGYLLPDFQAVGVTGGSKPSINRTFSNIQFDAYLDSLKLSATSLQEKPDKSPLNTQTSYTYFVTATNRIPDFNSALIGQLKRINYPTKGFSEFVYEANSYYGRNDEVFNPCSGNYESIGSATDNSIANCGDITSTFTVAEGAYSCMKVFWNTHLSAINQDEIVASLLIQGSGSTTYYEKNFICSHDETINDVGSEYKVFPPGTYTITLNMCGENPLSTNTSSISIDVQAIPVVVGSAYSTRISGGVRIKEVKDCPNANPDECLIKEYAYTPENEPTQSSGRIVTNGKYSYPIQYFTVENGGIPINANYLNSASQLPLSTSFGQYIGYNTVIVKEAKIEGGNRVYKGKTVYDYRSPDENEAPDLNGESFPYWSVSYDWKRGVVEQMKVYDQAGTWLKNEQSAYVLKPSLSYAKYTALKAGKFIYNLESAPNGYDPNIPIYAFNKYKSVSGFQYNEQSTNQEQLKNGANLSSIESVTQYVYGNDSHLQLTQTSTTDSKGDNLVTQYKYPNDITAGDLLPSAGLLVSRKTELLQTESFFNSSSVSKTQTFFDSFGGSQKTFVGGSSTPSSESIQLSYDSYANLTSFKEVGGATHSFLWGYNGQYPVIYIANGTPPDASALLTTFSASTIESTATTLRSSLPNAQISNYVFKPMIGMLSSTAPNELKTSFSFDGLNRLDKILDHTNKIVKAYAYQYASSIGGFSVIKDFTPRIGSTTLPSGFQSVQTLLSYVDGLGRPVQMVAQQAGAGGLNDIVSDAVKYDGFGRIEKSYIPFPNAGTGAMATLPVSVDGDTRPFTENLTFDDSPLNRLLKVRGVGDAWLSANKVSESSLEISGGIKSFTVSGGVVSSGTYPANSLYKKTDKDEQGNIVITYSDKQGRLVQKEQQLNATDYAITAYVYNNIGQLAFIIQPESYNSATSSGGVPFDKNDAIFALGVFGYEYDEQGRQVRKHVPSGGWTNLVYDKLDRVVLEQDETQASNNLWAFTKYDAFGRVVMQGETNNGSTRQSLQDAIDASSNQYEARNNTAPYFYSRNSLPSVTDAEVQSRQYYDLYDNWIPSNIGFQGLFTYQSRYLNSTGWLLGSLARKGENTSDWEAKSMFHNYQGLVIQDHQRNTDNTHYVRSQYDYDFAQSPTKITRLYQRSGFDAVLLKTENTYDHVGRVVSVWHGMGLNVSNSVGKGQPLQELSSDKIKELTINATSTEELVWYIYNDLGRLKQKRIYPTRTYKNEGLNPLYITRPTPTYGAVPSANTLDLAQKAVILNAGVLIQSSTLTKYEARIGIDLGSNNSTVLGMQTVDFGFHIRGMQNCINCTNGLPTLNGAENDFFAHQLDFEGDSRYFDGNISSETWKNKLNQGANRKYLYNYNAANYLLSAAYSGGQFSNESFGFAVSGYDKNGNVLGLTRQGTRALTNGIPTTFGPIDELTYFYNGNRLTGVTDGATDNEDVGDFRDNGSSNDYTYWENGSLKSDANRGISLIEWDTFLKKIKQITYSDNRWIKHFYDGFGKKLKTTDSQGTVWLYGDEVIYQNSAIYQISQPEGRIVPKVGGGTPPSYSYEFEYKDHLGNLRASFRDSLAAPVNGVYFPPVLTQENTYFPFGLSHTGTDFYRASANQFQYLGREKITSFNLGTYQLGARDFDPHTNRFWSTDPLIDQGQHSFTPYHYSFNNPIRFSDPSGLMGQSCCGDDPDGLGNGMTLVENLYWSTRDALVSSVATMTSFVGSITVGTPFENVQRINATYSSGSRKLSAETVPRGEVAGEVTGSMLTLASANPSVGSAGTGLLMAKTGPKASLTSSLVRLGQNTESAEALAKQAANAEAHGFPHGVSTNKVDRVKGSDKLHKSANTSDVEKVFEVKQTGNKPKHHTVILPKPVTQQVADKFNELFKLFKE
jgi:RHS repeat-associated protein